MAALMLAGCAQNPSLAPASDAELVAGTAVAIATAADIAVTAQGDAWRDRVDIDEALTPLRVSIVNNGDRSLLINYADFALVGDYGQRYAALPPYAIDATVTEPVLARTYVPLQRLYITHDGFYIAPHYHRVYPGLTPFERHRLYYDSRYYNHYYPYWQRMRTVARYELPTPEMLERALPEGVLEPGGRLEGFLYFEKLPAELSNERVRFHADFVDAATGERFAALHIPFVANPTDALTHR